jgi:2-polyprenyl-3-methyl-5-hydroxy-6-metoxy-1,4-benzoquinol methylase
MSDCKEIDLTQFAKSIVQGENGIYLAQSRAKEVFYREDFNNACFAVEDSSFWFTARNLCLLSLFERFKPEAPFFDIGGGNGFVALAAQQSGLPCVLVEPGAAGVANARQRGLKHLLLSSFEDAGFRPESLPSVGLFDVVEHISDDQAFLRSLHQAMKPDGLVFISVPAYQILWSDADNEAQHFRRYTRKSLEKVLQQSGFETVFSSYMFFWLPLPLFLFRLLPWRLRFQQVSESSAHQPQPWVAGIFSAMGRWESGWIRRGLRIPFGGSCLAVARRC